MIIFKDKHDTTEIKLSNFYRRYNSKPIFIETDIEINLKSSNHIEKTELELLDLKKLKVFFRKNK